MLKPVIAAVNGPARGAGCNLVFTADFRIVSERANFAVNFIERGVVAEYPLFFLSRLIGLQRATEICMLGEVFDAQLAHDWASPTSWFRTTSFWTPPSIWLPDLQRGRRSPCKRRRL